MVQIPELAKTAITSLVRKGVVVAFSYWGFDRVLTQPENAALAEWVACGVTILIGILITQAWSWLDHSKLLNSEPPQGDRT